MRHKIYKDEREGETCLLKMNKFSGDFVQTNVDNSGTLELEKILSISKSKEAACAC